MSLHDWTRVPAGIFHAFHNAWISDLQKSLNRGLLPKPYDALGEQRAGDMAPDVLTLHANEVAPSDAQSAPSDGEGMIAVAQSPPQARLVQEAAEDAAFYLARRRTLVIRHVSDDRVVALIEIVSPANKHYRQAVDDFLDKIVAALGEGVHVLLIDLFPPSRRDPQGMHGAVWERLMAGEYEPPEELPLTLTSYVARRPITAYFEPVAVGNSLPDMPLFLTPEHYVSVPLDSTYAEAFIGVPDRWRRVLEG